MFLLGDASAKLKYLEEKIEAMRSLLHEAIQKNNADLLNAEVISVSSKLDYYISEFTYLKSKAHVPVGECKKTA